MLSSHRLALFLTSAIAVFAGALLFPRISDSMTEEGYTGPFLILLSWSGVVGVVALLSFLVAEIAEEERIARDANRMNVNAGKNEGVQNNHTKGEKGEKGETEQREKEE